MTNPTPEAVEAVALRMQVAMGCLSWGVAYYETGMPVTCRTHKQQWTDAGCPAALAAAKSLTNFIRDAIHRDGPDADAIRDALGLYKQPSMYEPEKRWQLCGQWVRP